MFISKPVLVILFFLAIGSTAGFLYLLSARTVAPQATPVATNTVLVSPSFAPSSAAVESTVASSGALASNAEWKSYTSTSLSMKVEYPAGWLMDATESAVVRITSPVSGTASATTTLTFTREKKSSTSSKLVDFVKKQSEAYLKDGYSTSDATAYSIAEYDGTEQMYTKASESLREIIYPTKNYFYIVRISPGKNDHKAVIDEILKSVKIV
jgi:hypothetical protein